ncbi:putative aldouronate transport system permease protein [Paenibacillus castaneae]|nr:putative aldouronate transport system permease protein [Paenibacillus castaneae]
MKRTMKQLLRNYQLYIFLFPMVAYFVIFRYFPMYGVQIAFKDFYPLKGIWDSSWVGFEHFQRFFRSSEILMVIKNTLLLNLFSLIFGFPVPIILALMINQVLRMKFKKLVQTVIYAPHFISTVVIVGMVSLFLSPRSGVVNSIIKSLGLDPVFFMARPEFFKAIYIISEIWQHAGWGTIIYLAALASISPELHESAVVDGASKWQRVWYIDIPGIMATAVILLILESGRMLSLGFEKVYLMQNNLNRSASEVISTYVYKVGIQQADFSYATAIGLFEAVICLIVLMSVNMLAKKATNTSLW